jgi:hypothetical protein
MVNDIQEDYKKNSKVEERLNLQIQKLQEEKE